VEFGVSLYRFFRTLDDYNVAYTHCPLDVCSRSVTSVEVAGHRQLLASNAYLNSSTHTTCSERDNTQDS